MSKLDFLFYNFVIVIDAMILYALCSAFLEQAIKHTAQNVTAGLGVLVDKYYEAKKDFLDKLSKDDKEFLDRTGQNKRGYNSN